MAKIETFYRIDSLDELAALFDGFARIAADKYAQNPQLRRSAVLAFTYAAFITRRTIMGGSNNGPEGKPSRRGE